MVLLSLSFLSAPLMVAFLYASLHDALPISSQVDGFLGGILPFSSADCNAQFTRRTRLPATRRDFSVQRPVFALLGASRLRPSSAKTKSGTAHVCTPLT